MGIHVIRGEFHCSWTYFQVLGAVSKMLRQMRWLAGINHQRSGYTLVYGNCHGHDTKICSGFMVGAIVGVHAPERKRNECRGWMHSEYTCSFTSSSAFSHTCHATPHAIEMFIQNTIIFVSTLLCWHCSSSTIHNFEVKLRPIPQNSTRRSSPKREFWRLTSTWSGIIISQNKTLH